VTQIFQDPFYDEFGTWPLAYIPYGGADFGEVVAVAEAAAEQTDAAFYNSWTAFAARLREEAEAALKKGHRARRTRSISSRQRILLSLVSPAVRQSCESPAPRGFPQSSPDAQSRLITF
jgi:hypothetical protein